jgi:8-oxo-dGTP diphosphatase
VHRVHDGLPTHWIAFDFKARIDPKDAKRNEPDMQDEIAWFTLDVLPEPLHSQLPLALEKYRDKL